MPRAIEGRYKKVDDMEPVPEEGLFQDGAGSGSLRIQPSLESPPRQVWARMDERVLVRALGESTDVVVAVPGWI